MAWWSASTDASSARCWASRVASHRDLETLLHGFNRAYNARRQRVLKGRSPEMVVQERLGAAPNPYQLQSRPAVRSVRSAQSPPGDRSCQGRLASRQLPALQKRCARRTLNETDCWPGGRPCRAEAAGSPSKRNPDRSRSFEPSAETPNQNTAVVWEDEDDLPCALALARARQPASRQRRDRQRL